MNDTLSYLELLDLPENKNIKPFDFIEECPFCGSPIRINDNETYAFCSNEQCPELVIGTVERYLKKLDIKGVKKSTIRKLYDEGLIENILSLYSLDYSIIKNIPGLGEKSANVIKTAINSKVPYDYELLAGVGMEDFGLSNAKVLCGEYPIYEIMANYEDSKWINSLYSLEGFSDIKINKLLRDIDKNYNLIADLFNTVDYKEIKEEMKNIKTDKFYTFVVTGDLETWKRDEFKGLLMKMGHKLVGSISKKTDYLITNDTNSGTVKNKKAMELGVPIINEEQLKELLGL